MYRPYSPVNRPGTDTLILAVKRYEEGTCSVWLHERKRGDSVSLLPPSGGLSLRSLLDVPSASHPQLSVAYVLSDDAWPGPPGYVQEHVDEALGFVDEPDIYVCGVPQMVVGTRTVLETDGVSSDRIIMEGWEEGVVKNGA